MILLLAAEIRDRILSRAGQERDPDTDDAVTRSSLTQSTLSVDSVREIGEVSITSRVKRHTDRQISLVERSVRSLIERIRRTRGRDACQVLEQAGRNQMANLPRRSGKRNPTHTITYIQVQGWVKALRVKIRNPLGILLDPQTPQTYEVPIFRM